MPSQSNPSRTSRMRATILIACLVATSATPAKSIIDPPLAGPLLHGRVVTQYRTAALAVSPRVGHIHVSIDDSSWVWADASGEPIIINGLPPGPHKVLIQLQTADHQQLDQGAVEFTVPAAQQASVPRGAAAVQAFNEPPAKIFIDSPLAERYADSLPVYGPAALNVTPRIGHIPVTVNGATWHWADASGVPL